MQALELILLVDILVVFFCSLILVKFGRLGHSHPATIYLFFHIYTFTQRIFGVFFGAPTLFSTWGAAFEPVTIAELVRAAILADAALIIMTIAWVRASIVDARRNNYRKYNSASYNHTLSIEHIWRIVIIAFPVGIVGLALLSRLPGVDNSSSAMFGEWQSSSWITITQAWVGLCLLALIYWYGLRWWLMLPMIAYLFIMAYQGYHRYRVIIPVILLLQIYLDRKKLRWPSLRIVVLIITFTLIFFPLKAIGRMAQEGSSLSDIVSYSKISISDAISGSADDQTFLDQYASGLTLIDHNGIFYYGKTYLSVLTLPIPRQLWPNKPGLVEYMSDFSRPWRPMKESGMIITFLGESYANFGYIGIIVVPYVLAYFIGRLYFKAYRKNYYSIERFVYLIIACNFFQVFRDGLISIIIFTFVNMMPLMVIVLLHWVFPIRKKESVANWRWIRE